LRVRAVNYAALASATAFAGQRLSSLAEFGLLILSGVFAMGFACCVSRLVHRNGLEIGAEGIVQVRDGRGRLIPWSEIDNFRVSERARRRVILFDVIEPLHPESILRGLLDDGPRPTGSLGYGFEHPPERVAAWLLSARAGWADGGAGPSPA
jgi:hypothetical protein